MADLDNAANPELAREYSKLFTAASKSREVCPEHVCFRIPHVDDAAYIKASWLSLGTVL